MNDQLEITVASDDLVYVSGQEYGPGVKIAVGDVTISVDYKRGGWTFTVEGLAGPVKVTDPWAAWEEST